jgi:hypothetical protein
MTYLMVPNFLHVVIAIIIMIILMTTMRGKVEGDY